MSEKAKDSFTDIAKSAFDVLYQAIMRRDESMVTPEVMRVAKALCHANGGQVDCLIYYGIPMQNSFRADQSRIYQDRIVMAWTAYVSQATCAIANLERHRDEELANRKAAEEKDRHDNPIRAGRDTRLLDIVRFAEKPRELREMMGVYDYTMQLEKDRDELLRRLSAAKLIPPYRVARRTDADVAFGP